MNAKGSFANQISVIIRKLYDIILKEKPNRFLVLGDTNSSLGAIVAKRLKIPIFHMEAGNRQFDDVVPEEINRRVIDTSSDILLPYTSRSAQNLEYCTIHQVEFLLQALFLFIMINFIKI